CEHVVLLASPTRRSSDLGHAQGPGQVAAVGGRRVEVVQRLGHQQVGVGVEAPGELLALVAQVALDLELDAVEVVVELDGLQLAADRKSTRLNSSHVKISY